MRTQRSYTKAYDDNPKQVARQTPFASFSTVRRRLKLAMTALNGLPHLEYATGTWLAISKGEQNVLSKEMTEGN